MPPLTYAQIRREKDLYGNQFADMDPAQYAAFMNNLLGNNDYDAGQGNWFAQGAKALSYGVDQALRATHLPQSLGDLGQNFFGDVGRHTFEGAPRMAIDMLPFMRAGKLGMALGGGAMALNTFEKTNSAGAAAVAAATAPLFGPLAKWGGEAAVGLGSRMGMNVARTQAGAAGVGGIGLLAGDAATSMVGRGLATSLATGGVLKSGLARGVEVAGQQTGMMGANLASQALVGAAAAPTGQRWDTVKQMFTTDLGATLGAAALTQLPFAAWSGAKAAYGAPAAEVKFVKDYAQTLAKYDKAVYGPGREAVAQGNLKLAANIETAKLRTAMGEQKLGLPAPSTRTADAFARDFVGERFSSTTPRTDAAINETANASRLVKPMEKKLRSAIKAKDPLLVSLYTGRLAKLRERAGLNTEDILNNPAPNRKAASGQIDYTAQLADPSPEVRLKAAMEVNGETPETIQVQVDALQAKGESLAKSAETVTTVQTERAIRAEALRARREQERVEREAARKAVKDAATIKDNETFTAIVKPIDEVTNAITRGITRASTEGAEHVDILDRVKTAVLNWHAQYGRDVAKLPELERMIGGVLKQTSSQPVNDKSRAYVSDDTPTAPVATKGVPGKKYTSVEAANAARDAIKDAPDGNSYQWSVEKIVPPASKTNPDRTPHWVISRREWASTTVQQGGKEVVDQTLTPDELTARLDEEVGDMDMTPQLDVDPVVQQTMGKFGEAHEGAEESVIDAADQVVGDEHGAKTTVENILSAESLAANLSETEARMVGRKILTKSDPDNAVEEASRGRARLVAAMDVVAKMRNGVSEEVAVSQYVNSESALWKTYKAWELWKDDKTLGDSSPYNILLRWTRQLNQVTANKGKQFLSLTGNYSAGGGFWYNVGVYNNGKIGKHVLPKDGVIPVEQFRKIGRGTDQPLTNDEVALYKVLVPEAFVGDKVNVKTFYEALPKREPTVEIVTMGKRQQSLSMQRRAALEHQLDTANPNWRDYEDTSVYPLAKDVNELSPEIQTLIREYKAIEYRPDSAQARYGSVAPRAERDMPGYVEGLVRVPDTRPIGTNWVVTEKGKVLTVYDQAYYNNPQELAQKWLDYNKHIYPDAVVEPRPGKQRGSLYDGPHFGSEDTNVIGFFRGFVDTLPDGTPFWHRIEQQTDVVVSHGEGETKTFTVRDHPEFGEFKSKNEAFEAAKKLHPLFGAYVEMTTKAELLHIERLNKERAAKGLPLIKGIFSPDSPTAMMSEGHDAAAKHATIVPATEQNVLKAQSQLANGQQKGALGLSFSELTSLASGKTVENTTMVSPLMIKALGRDWENVSGGKIVSQEGGMRLHYDTTLPSELRKISGDKGQRVELGTHAKQRVTERRSQDDTQAKLDALESKWLEKRITDEEYYAQRDAIENADPFKQVYVGSPVFKDALGNPKTNVTGTLYDISNVKMSMEGSGAQMGLGDQKVFMGERMALGELARNVGLTLNDVPELARIVALRDGSDIAYAQLQSGTETMGLFTQQRDGQKLVWLAANGDPATRMIFAMAHEYNGHGIFQAMREGRLDAETSSRLQAYMDHISENSPEVNSMLLRELWTTLPKRYRKDDGLQKLVNSRLTDSEEVLSNFNAIISLGLAAKGRPGWISEALTWLPKPIGDAMVAFASWGRKTFEAINGLMFMRKQNWTRGIVDPAELGQMHDYVKTMHSVLRANRTREAQLEQSIRMQMVNEPKYMLSALADGSMWADGVTSAGDTLVKEFRLLEPPPEKRSVKETIGAMLSKPNRGLNHFLMPLVNYAQRHGWLRHTVVGAAEKAAKNASIENEILKEMGLVRKGMAYRADDSHPMSKVAASPVMRKILNDITWRANVMETTVEQLVASGDKVIREALAKLPTEQQTIVRESVARGEVANTRLNEMIHREQYERLVFVTGESLMLKDSNMSWETAEARARQIVGEVQSGQITSVDDVVPFVQKVAGRIEKQVDWFKNRPYFVSARRFGEHSIRVNKRDGTHEVLDFRTADERQAWMVQNREAIVKGDLTPYLLKAEQKTYSITQTALDMIKDLEAGQKDEIVNELVRVGIAADAAEGIADRFSQSSYLQRELQARNVPSMSPHRKFVAGYESLDVIRQQIEYLQMVTHTLTKGISNARFEMQMRDPRTRDLPEAKSIRQAWQQNQAPDMKGTQLMQRAGYTWYMAGHLLNMIQDAVTPLSGALYGNLVDDGGGVMATGKRLMTAMADAKSPKRQTAFERQMLERYKKGNRGLASFTDEGANDYLATFNAHEKLKGYNVSTMGQLLTRPVAAGFLHMRNFHKHFTDFGLEAGLLATFRHFKAKGLADAVAEKEAFALQTIAMGGGKYNRPAGLWASGRLQPLSAAMSLLQGFAYNQMFTFKNFFEKSLGTVPNLTREQRINATKAFATHSGLMFAQAGIFGIPMAAAIMAIIDKVFDTNSKENIANFINENVDVVDGDVERQIAMHGLINAFGGVDYASKAQIPGVLGFNAQNGFSFESLAGPMAGLGNVALESLQALAQGDVGGAVANAMPNNFRRLLQSWKNDWEFRRKDGSMVAETTPTDKALYALMGLRPRSVADIVERDQWQAIDANIERNANESWKEDMVELFREDPVAARAEILKRANERQESPAAIANSVVDQIMEKQMPRDAGRRPGASEKVNKAAGVTATPISEVQRLQSQQAFLQQLGLGLPATPTAFERAMQIDGIRAQNPWLSYDEAVRRVDGQSGALQSRMMRGASFGLR